MAAPSTLEKRLAHEMGRCIADFELIEAGDRVMVAISGGKDSYTLLHLLERARQRAPVPFELIAVHLDQGHPGYDGSPLRGWLERKGYTYRIVSKDTYRIVTERIPRLEVAQMVEVPAAELAAWADRTPLCPDVAPLLGLVLEGLT